MSAWTKSEEQKMMSDFDRFLYSHLGKLADKMLTHSLRESLRKAFPEVYPPLIFSKMLFYRIIATIFVVIFIGILPSFFPPPVSLPNFLEIRIAILILLLAFSWISLYMAPKSKISSRKKVLERELPYAVNFMASLASANVAPQRIFGALARQREIFKEASKEAALIYRDLVLFGYDLSTAISNAIARSPSEKWQDFLQGIITVIYTGGDLKSYFMAKADQYMFSARAEQRRDIEALGVIIESFVVVGVAAPVFLIIIILAMGWVSTSAAQAKMIEPLLKLIMYVMLPIIYIVYVYLIYDSVKRKV